MPHVHHYFNNDPDEIASWLKNPQEVEEFKPKYQSACRLKASF